MTMDAALNQGPQAGPDLSGDRGLSLFELFRLWADGWRWLVFGPLLAGVVAAGISLILPKVYTATSVFIPPQASQGGAAAALASLGALSALAGGAAGVRTPADQYVALMQSVTVSDRIIDRFDLMKVYDAELRVDARKELGRNVRINVGRKDGLIAVSVDDGSPQRAAEMANRFIDELRDVTAKLAITEAQQRRQFFEQLLADTRQKLAKAQLDLQASGVGKGTLKVEPRVAAEAYARVLAQITATELRLRALRNSLSDSSPEVSQQLAILQGLRSQQASLEGAEQPGQDAGYVGKYREFKYQEALFELYARQFEIARADESREGALIQTVDVATPPERRTHPRRAMIVLGTIAVSLVAMAAWLAAREAWRRARRGDGRTAP